MFTNQEVDYLLNLPKKIIADGNLIDQFNVQQKFPFYQKWILGSEDDEDYIFLMEVQQSSKFSIKFDLHHQEDQSKIGLIRINYFGKHKNPENITDKVPADLVPFAGKWFDFNEHHIHYYVEGYKPLAWAIPLINDNFPVKSITENSDIVDSFLHFCKRINLITTIVFEETII